MGERGEGRRNVLSFIDWIEQDILAKLWMSRGSQGHNPWFGYSAEPCTCAWSSECAGEN